MENLIELCSVPLLETNENTNSTNQNKKIKFSVEILKPAFVDQKFNGNSIGTISTAVDQLKQNNNYTQTNFVSNNNQIKNIISGSATAADSNTIIEHRTVYHIVKPNDLGLKLKNSILEVKSNDNSCESYRLFAKKRSQKKRSLLEKKSQYIQQSETNQQQNDKQMVNNNCITSPSLSSSSTASTTLKTRCGRISRPPTHMNKFISEIPALVDNNLSKSMGVNELIRFQVTNNEMLPIIPITEKTETVKRNIPNYYRCNTCQKIYLGKNKRARHLKNFPTHEMPALPDETNLTTTEMESGNNDDELQRFKKQIYGSNIFDFLIAKIDNHSTTCEQSRTGYFLNQLSEFVEKINCVKSKLLGSNNCNNGNNTNRINDNNLIGNNSSLIVASSNLQYIDKNVSRIFGIQEGNYYVNLDSIFLTNDHDLKAQEFNENHREHLEVMPPSTTSLGYGEVTELFPVVDPSTTSGVVGSHCFTANSSNANCAVADDVVGAAGLGEESLFAAVHGINLDELGHTTLRNNLLSFDDIISDNAVERPTNSSPPSQKLDFSNLINN